MPINSTPGKNLNLCFTKIKWPLAPQSSPPMSPTSLSQDHDDDDHHHHNTFPSTTTTSSSTLIKNFNSLYDSTSKSLSHSSSSLSTTTTTTTSSSSSFKEPDYTAAFASHRFFFSSPGLSNSIIQSTTYLTGNSCMSFFCAI
jgi:hypothetical protein